MTRHKIMVELATQTPSTNGLSRARQKELRQTAFREAKVRFNHEVLGDLRDVDADLRISDSDSIFPVLYVETNADGVELLRNSALVSQVENDGLVRVGT